jgi:hypothetical protein
LDTSGRKNPAADVLKCTMKINQPHAGAAALLIVKGWQIHSPDFATSATFIPVPD